MWQELVLVHRDSGSDSLPLEGTGKLWRTCLRELLFLEPGAGADTHPGASIKCGLQAHRLLVEICSGLHSPLFGETEVFGQFRAFRETQSWDPLWCSLLDAVEEDVRKVRRTHLTNIGSQSYGSLARRQLEDGEKVLLLGGGKLAQEMLPWLKKQEVTVAVRNPAKVKLVPTTKIISLSELNQTGAFSGYAWLLAAPVCNEDLLRWWQTNPPRSILDFRSEASFEDSQIEGSRYQSLRAFFAELEKARQLHARKREEALQFSGELSSRREQAVLHRPYGWEDAFS
ncbi:MAG TPA: hypothetical protein VIH99_12990 [Bdellovibrionota bacterium]|jgi:glutamyl-tRNA reductase